MKTKVTLHNSKHDELELGPFNQGVLIEPEHEIGGRQVIHDVATGDLVAKQLPNGWLAGKDHHHRYRQAFIQPVVETDIVGLEKAFGEALDELDMQIDRAAASLVYRRLAGQRSACPDPSCEHSHCITLRTLRGMAMTGSPARPWPALYGAAREV